MFSNARDFRIQAVFGGSSSRKSFSSSALYLDGSRLRDFLFRRLRIVDARIGTVADFKLAVTKFLLERDAKGFGTSMQESERFADRIVRKIPQVIEALHEEHQRRAFSIETWFGMFQLLSSLQEDLRARSLPFARSGVFSHAIENALEMVESLRQECSEVPFGDRVVDAFVGAALSEGCVAWLPDFLGDSLPFSIERTVVEIFRNSPATASLRFLRYFDALRDGAGLPVSVAVVDSISLDLWGRSEWAQSLEITVSKILDSVEQRSNLSGRSDSPQHEFVTGYVLGHIVEEFPERLKSLVRLAHPSAITSLVVANSVREGVYSLKPVITLANTQLHRMWKLKEEELPQVIEDVPLPLRLLLDMDGVPKYARGGVDLLRSAYFSGVSPGTAAFMGWRRLALELEGGDTGKFCSFLLNRIGVTEKLLHAVAKAVVSWSDLIEQSEELIEYFEIEGVHSLIELASRSEDGFDDLAFICDRCRSLDSEGKSLPLTITDIELADSTGELVQLILGPADRNGRLFP